MIFLNSERFGALPEGEELTRVMASPHQVGGIFQNLEPMRVIAAEEQSFARALVQWLFLKLERPKPQRPLPSERVPLSGLFADTVIWLGHSSFFLRLAGQNILIDPVLSAYGSPFFLANRAFEGTLPYTAADMPFIDVLCISHDHWDHLDWPTLKALRPRVRNVLCGLGCGAHLLRWGYDKHIIFERDWGDTLELSSLGVTLTTSRHFSGRTLTDHDRTLWCGFIFETARRRLYFSGDGGYGAHFARTGREHGPFDLVMLDSGQYNARWPHVHMFPEEAAKAALELGAKHFMPVHCGRFCLSQHAWDEPLRRQAELAGDYSWRLLTPPIGRALELADTMPEQPRWWEGIDAEKEPS